MFTKERDGGNMEEEEKGKKVEKIVINSTGVFPEAHPNNTTTRVEHLDLEAKEDKLQENETQEKETQGNEIQEILSQNGIDLLLYYTYDEKIVYALKENGDQLKAYMETCRKASYPTKKVDVPDTIPEIEYDLRDLKNWYPEIEDKVLRMKKQIGILNEAIETRKVFGDKVSIKIGRLLKWYFSVQDLFLLQRRKQATETLPSGENSIESNYRRSIYSPKNRDAVDRVSKNYTAAQLQVGQAQENVQKKEDDEVLAK